MKLFHWIKDNKLEPLAGATLALVAVNTPLSPLYHALVHFHVLHWLVNEACMALFFGVATKEIFEQMALKRSPGKGQLYGVRRAALPFLSTAGGMVGPIAACMLMVWLFDRPEFGAAWPIPTATDIAFSLIAARIIYGDQHIVVKFLLTLAVLDDGGGMGLIAVFLPQAPFNPLGLAFIGGASLLTLVLKMGFKVNDWRPYILICGPISGFGLWLAGLHTALALIPVIPFMPHAETDWGVFAEEKMYLTDSLNQFEHAVMGAIGYILLAFGFMNSGVEVSTVGFGTGLITASLILGKPLGILLFTAIGVYGLNLELPKGMNMKDVLVMGFIAGIGFTVALFVTGAAYPQPGEVQDQLKLGALLSLAALPISVGVAKLLRVGKYAPSVAVADEDVAPAT